MFLLVFAREHHVQVEQTNLTLQEASGVRVWKRSETQILFESRTLAKMPRQVERGAKEAKG